MVGQTPVNLHTPPTWMWQLLLEHPDNQVQLTMQPRWCEGLNAGIASRLSPRSIHPVDCNFLVVVGAGRAWLGRGVSYKSRKGQLRRLALLLQRRDEIFNVFIRRLQILQGFFLMAKAELQHHPHLSRLLCCTVISLSTANPTLPSAGREGWGCFWGRIGQNSPSLEKWMEFKIYKQHINRSFITLAVSAASCSL